MHLLQKVITFIDIAAPLIALCFFLFGRKVRSVESLFILSYILIQIVLNSTAKYMMFDRTNNSRVYQANCFLSMLVLSAYFLYLFKSWFRDGFYKIFRYVIAVAVVVLLFIVFTEDTLIFNSRSYSFMAFCTSFLSFIYYYHKLVVPVNEKIITTPTFWYNTGIFVYYTAAFFIFSTYKSFVEHRLTDVQILWGIHNALILLMNISFSIGFLCRYQKT